MRPRDSHKIGGASWKSLPAQCACCAGTPASNGAAVSGPVTNINGNANGSPAGPAITNSAGVGAAGTNSAGMSSLAGGVGSTLASTQTVSAQAQGGQGISAQPTAAATQYTPSQQVYNQVRC